MQTATCWRFSWEVITFQSIWQVGRATIVEAVGKRAAVQCGGGLNRRQGGPARRGGRLVHP